MSAQYDLAGNLIGLTYPSSRHVAYRYNAANRLNQVQFNQWNGAAPPAGTYNYWSAADTDFHPNGAPKRWTLPNRVTESRALNPRLQLQEETITNSSLGNLGDHVYNYGPQNNGNILGVTDQLNSSRTQSFTYDALNRLATANEGRWGLSFAYDPWGNRLQQNVTAGNAGQIQITVDANNRIQGAPANCTAANMYCYDAAGNLLQDSLGHRYVYDAENRIGQVDNGAATYTYDADGNRVRKDVSGSPSTEYFDFGGNLIAELNLTTNDWSDYIFANGQRIARSDTSKWMITTSGTQCSSCGWQWNIFWLPANLDNHGYVIRAGDKLASWQWSSSTARGGMNLWFTDGTNTLGAPDQDGQASNNDTMTQIWHSRLVDLSSYAGKTIANAGLVTEGYTPAGDWGIQYTDMGTGKHRRHGVVLLQRSNQPGS
jgi:YD repeat-containing protein